MFDQIKAGYVLRFAVSPHTILSPPAGNGTPDTTLLTAWPAVSTLGAVTCLSHPSGAIGDAAALAATGLRDTPNTFSRSLSYSGAGRALSQSNRPVGGAVNCDFVGYVDGQTNYIASAGTVFSKDFSGCLMAVYTLGGQRYVAHVAASGVPTFNCKQTFLTKLQSNGATLIGWFRPYTSPLDDGTKIESYNRVKKYLGNVNDLTTFGVITAANVAYSITAFRPKGIPGNDWVVTHVDRRPLSVSFVAP